MSYNANQSSQVVLSPGEETAVLLYDVLDTGPGQGEVSHVPSLDEHLKHKHKQQSALVGIAMAEALPIQPVGINSIPQYPKQVLKDLRVFKY